MPVLPPRTQRFVSLRPNRQGIYELGPFTDNAYGVGDLLMITPTARALGKKAVMLLPSFLENRACLFHDLCPIRFTEDYPVFPFRCTPDLISIQVLRMFNLPHADPIPKINVQPEQVSKAREVLKGFQNPIAFCPTCSRTWSHVRQRAPTFWQPIVEELQKRYTIAQFGFDDYPLVPGAVRVPFLPLATLAAAYQIIGNYVGVHTGDYHLMVACGGRAIVAEPDPMPDAGHSVHWNYLSIPQRVQYGKLSHPSTMLRAIKTLGL